MSALKKRKKERKKGKKEKKLCQYQSEPLQLKKMDLRWIEEDKERKQRHEK